MKISLFGGMGLWQCFENFTTLIASNADIGTRIDIVFSCKGVIVTLEAIPAEFVEKVKRREEEKLEGEKLLEGFGGEE